MANVPHTIPLPGGTPAAVRELTHAVLARHFPGHDTGVVERTLAVVQELFAGRYPGYKACDTKFHDFTHTCDATLGVLRILDGQSRSGDAPRLTVRDFEVGLAAILLHDAGYIKEDGDTLGTGAKYTRTHVERSAQFAAKFLPPFGFTDDEIRIVQLAIRCTGLNVDTSKLPFHDDRERLLGCALGTGDMLGQLASAEYPARLPALYEEFREGGVPGYTSAADLMRQTRGFVTGHVQQMLTTQWGNVARYLDRHFGSTTTPYRQSIAANLDAIDCSLAGKSAP
jgi:hypothetical protein